MFVLKSLLGKMWGNPANPELIQLTAGQLYLVRPNSIKGLRECIFKDSVATIRRTGVDYQYQLVVTRAYEDGEEQLLEEDAETDDERVFLIDQTLSFNFGSLDGDSTFSWKDMNGDEGDQWEFVSGKAVPKPTIGLFEVTLLHCIYERQNQRSHEEATDEELQIIKRSMNEASASSRRQLTSEILHSAVAELSMTHSEAEKEADSAGPSSSDPFPDVPIFSTANAELYLFDTDADVFVIQEKAVKVQMASNGPYDTWIIIRQGSVPYISTPIDTELNPQFDMANHALMFTFRENDDLPGMTWCLKFGTDVFATWKDSFTIKLWEGKNKMDYGKAKANEQRYIQDAYEDVEMTEPEEDDVEEGDGEEQEDDEAVEGVQPNSTDDEEESEEQRARIFGKGSRNEHLAVGYKNDASFVTRGDMIGVFGHQKEGGMRFRTAIDRIKNTKGTSFSPRKIMLHDQDSNMLMLDPNNPNAVYRMDLERGQIVDEWKVSDDLDVSNIVPDAKFSQMTSQQTFIGHSHNGLFRIDPRVSGNKLVETQFKQYASKNDFSAAATTESGKLAVASNKGDIRLFDAIGKNAKTALPALGDPIIGLDVTADGRWVVATCKNYLLLIDTLIGDGRYKGSSGFDRSFPADSKPLPRRLQLKAEHVAYMNEPVSFTPARFNTDVSGGAEKTIVTSTGPYVVTWNFRRLKQGRTDDYQIKQYESRVVADDFKFGADKDIIIALEQNVLMASKKDMLKPTRTSLANLSTPVKKIRESHSQIVHSPY